MQRLQQTLMRMGGIVALLFGMVWLGIAPASAHGAASQFLTVTDTRECSAGTPVLANFQAKLWLAWTGCDAQHHLNIEYSTDGKNWGNKVTLTDTARDSTGPALVPYNNRLYIAWAGTDSPTHMYIGYFNNSSTLLNHTRLADSTYQTPSMAIYSSRIWLAWTGTDTAHHLNFEGSSDGITFTSKATATDGSSQGPAIATFNSKLYVGWEGTDGHKSENVAYFNGGTSLLGKVTFPEGAEGGHAGMDVGMAVGHGELWLAAFCGGTCDGGLRHSTDGTHWSPTPPEQICEGSDIGCSFYGVKLASFGTCDEVWQAWKAGTTATIWVAC